MKRRRGFTIVELMVVVLIVGLLSTIAVPKFKDVRRRATATQIMGDFDVIRHAALSFYVDSSYFPTEGGGPGAVPPGLVRYLPTNFSFKKPLWTIGFENWSTADSKEFQETGIVIGVSFITPDTVLGRTAMALMGHTPAITIGNKYVFLISAFQ